MRIVFDIKYRPEIESGKYKLITSLGDPVEILRWDAKGDLGPIIGLVKEKREDKIFRWSIEGPGLYIITDDQDMTPFEAALAQFITEKNKIPVRKDPLKDWIQSAAKRLLAIAKEEIEQEPKQEWSEEDKRNLYGIQLIIEGWDREHNSPNGIPSLVPKYSNWLKSLCPQKRWRPNNEQMNALKEQCVNLKSTHSGSILCELYSKLKKL